MSRTLRASLYPWWQQREPRERQLLLAMSAMLAAFVLWFGVYRPLDRAASRAISAHAHAAARFEQARQDALVLQGAGTAMGGGSDPATLRRAVLGAASQAGLAMSRHAQDTEGLRIEADAATPAQLLGWLDRLRIEHHLAPDTLSAAQSEGRLRVQARFAAPAGPGDAMTEE